MMNETDQSNLEQAEKKSQRGIYLLPNLLTTAALFAGFFSIVSSMNQHFEQAAIAIFIAMVADTLDGRVARLTNTQTQFGAQYDSLSDMVAFGIAPALGIYSWSLHHLGKLGWLAAFLYAAATALRLARFNTQAADKRYFQGLPSPSAAGIVSGLMWIGSNYEVDGAALSLVAATFSIVAAALMVSTVRYSSFKSVDFKGRVPFITVVIALFIIVGIAIEPALILFSIFLIYVISGPILTLWQLRKMRKQRLFEHKSLKK